ncbi:MAG TPA: MFS transporter, partial [Terriglobales bacterium]|nr:MFS transporter [Terriglobales bacterium]
LLLGTIGFASQFPVFLVAPIGGTVADRYNRRKLVIATQTSSMVLALILAALTLSQRVQIWHIFVLAALLGVVNAFDIPARQAFMVEMVGKEDLLNAIALNSSMFNGARILGPAIAGILVAGIGEGWCFFANGVSYVAVIIGLLLMRVEEHRGRTEGTPLSNIVEGFRYVQRTIPIRNILLLLGLVSLVAMPYAVLMPIFADRILHGGARGLGILVGATGVGALLAGLTLATRQRVRGLGRIIGVAAVGFSLSLIAFAWSRSFALSLMLLVPVGYFMMLESTASNTLIQAMVADHFRGRVMAVYSMMFMGMAPFGSFFAGALASRLGAPLTLTIGAAVCVVGGALFLFRLPVMRIEARRLIVAQGLAGGDPPQEIATAGMASEPFSLEQHRMTLDELTNGTGK